MASDRLNDFERDVLVPLVCDILRNAPWTMSALSIAEAIRRQGHPASTRQVRKVINHIRVNGIIPCVASSPKGFFVASNGAEITETINSLEGRVDAIQEVIDALKEQRYIKYDM